MRNHLLSIAIFLLFPPSAHASVTTYTNKVAWQNAVAHDYTTITFTEFPTGNLSDQYAYLGMRLVQGNASIWANEDYINDGRGLRSNFITAPFVLGFDAPIYAVAIDFRGTMGMDLYLNEQLIFSANSLGCCGEFRFGGLVSTQPFNRVRFHDDLVWSTVSFDDLFFGPPIPAPGAVALLGLTAIVQRRRRA